MASKALILLGLFALVLVVSEMAAAAGTVKSESEEIVQPDGYGGGFPGGHGRGGYNKGKRGGGGGYCRHGCCYKGYHGCSRCCSYAGEAVQTQPGH